MAEPKFLIAVGLIFSLFLGTVMPAFGVILSKLLFGLSHPPNTIPEVRSNANFYCLMMLVCAVGAAVFIFFQKYTFGTIGENVTLKIRRQLYASILEKHIGWFDNKENSPGQLSTILASDAQTINGVSAEGLASQLEASCALIGGITLGFIFCWRESIVCLFCVPFMIVASVI
jgi:ATP-binding cassette subfamily B (MDR/TAP) protein 1